MPRTANVITIHRRMYEVAPGRLYAGALPASPDIDEIDEIIKFPVKQWGVSRFINLMEPDERDHAGKPFNSYEASAARFGAEMVRFPIRDMSIPTESLMKEILNYIDQQIALKKAVYVHCWGGFGRTGVVVGCWLKRHGESNPVAKIHQLRRNTINASQGSPQSSEQFEMISRWRIGE